MRLTMGEHPALQLRRVIVLLGFTYSARGYVTILWLAYTILPELGLGAKRDN
jgi:hypothetical protein